MKSPIGVTFAAQFAHSSPCSLAVGLISYRRVSQKPECVCVFVGLSNQEIWSLQVHLRMIKSYRTGLGCKTVAQKELIEGGKSELYFK